MGFRINLIGKRFGRLKVLYYLVKDRKWKCLCKCGNKTTASTSQLMATTRNHGSKQGKQSCGCLRSELAVEKGKNNKPRSDPNLIRYLRAQGTTYAGIGILLNISSSTAYRLCNADGLDHTPVQDTCFKQGA